MQHNTNPISSTENKEMWHKALNIFSQELLNPDIIDTKKVKCNTEVVVDIRYAKTINREGVKIVIDHNYFELSAELNAEIWEQQVIQLVREWIRARKPVDEALDLNDN